MTSTNCSMRPSYIPVPVPPLLTSFNTKSNVYHNFSETQSLLHRNVCHWALHLPDVQRACSLAHVCTETKPKYVRIKTNIKAIIQNGPTCGLTALNMLTGDIISIDDILSAAKQKQFTNHGEMFCAKHLQELAIFLFDSLNYPVTIELFSGKLNCDRIKHELQNGACILVAYPFQLILLLGEKKEFKMWKMWKFPNTYNDDTNGKCPKDNLLSLCINLNVFLK